MAGVQKNAHHASFFNGAVALICSCALSVTLLLWVGAYSRAEFRYFDVVSVLGFAVGLVAFRNIGQELLDVRVRWNPMVRSLMRRWLLTFAVVLFALYLAKIGEVMSRLVMVGWLLSTPFVLLPMLLLCRRMAISLYSAPGLRRKAVFVFFDEEAAQLAATLRHSPILGITPLGYFDDRDVPRGLNTAGLERLGSVAKANEWIMSHRVDMVFLGLRGAHGARAQVLLDSLLDSVVSIYFVPDYRPAGLRHVQYAEMGDMPVLVAYETPFLGLSRVCKRAMDIVMSLFLLALASPAMVLCAIAVRLSSPGPILFRQKRYGAGGVEISVYKFRSMRNDPLPTDGVVQQAKRNDPRVTPVGAILRKTSLDELPQFFNVLGGSMSIVGPRPHAVQHNELYRRQVRGYMLRHKVKPGITGWAQVNGARGETSTLDKMERRVELDLHYIRNWSLMLDLRIIFMTALLVIRDRHAF
ncbi:undecaprenyl-phosphate glucose phosphotransferase [Xylophilus sp. GOD-11R]|uniref:undecaprenyl-phosphate glucose phosphotransferase n=1 Tax=Xylophilus sp. GOD-11R TaxID=3089814 RepID=UPI00298C3F6C|nr:undecaprenyl-phosphate glucose phosphotransferase [Xylophilus sp. GOD-11R]WPB56108.1 undecaprenyl-phosphate glucose phosphotransferase [Xylophilus sp. GOD-11R]